MTRSGNGKKMDEARLASEAGAALAEKQEQQASEKELFVLGKPLPDDFVNPECGTMGHRCVQIVGGQQVYRPDWVQLKIHKLSENMPSRQFFCLNGRQWYVQVGVWLDAPAEILGILERTEVEVISMDIQNANPLTTDGVEKVVERVPRFAYTSLPSA